MIYLDNNASTPIAPSVRRAISDAMCEHVGNPSSAHTVGRQIRRLIEHARDNLANLLHVDPDLIYFTSGATEANNVVLQSVNRKSPRGHVVTTPVEHPSVLEPAKWLADIGATVDYAKIGADGLIDLSDLRQTLALQPDLVSVQWVNNETGVVQPIREIAEICREQEVALHVDAAQAVGKLDMCLGKFSPDFVSVSGHKFHGPAGVGALVCREPKTLRPLLIGGGQEHGLRSGTENWPGIVGIGLAASDLARNLPNQISRLASLREQLEEGVLGRVPRTKAIAANSPRVPNTTNIQFVGLDGQALVAQLNAQGIMCSQTSACSNQRPEPSYVLRAMGLSEEEAYSCVRFSVSTMNTEEEINEVVETIEQCANRLLTFAEANR